ncbi:MULTISPECIES: hypothetical protein [Aliarcobacter]|jgi:hypothetical protein|uniref:hypothetical protein n=1 Tax=Aliarcobacter TaxID=2321111 RepID=UPI00112F787A|nr:MULTISPECIES: hypothetical protein [Aliarcobacter]MCT7519592.1 hypothetical protein [Aliarcobacter cryaerophilus]MDX3959837.1 hypothetical protein [Aliarcobacter skirrowii]MDX4012742.1 hypothetical protein [Aliarcobacter skirrowii]MDX4026520.1 hypothetical protein [Aliarcobacter skirrowii]MDX4037638.1 hypothetical protein [Aliarcobacter skirrowii]
MKLVKILEKAKKYLFLIDNNEELKQRKIEKLRDKLEDKISKIDKKIKKENSLEDILKLKEERNILKNFRKQLKEKSR